MSHFEKIYQAALHRNEEELKEILSEDNVSIDKYAPEEGILMTVACKLAMQANFDAVEFLQGHGASPSEIATGLGMGGHYEYLANFLREYPEPKNYAGIVCGLACSGRYETLKCFLRELPENIAMDNEASWMITVELARSGQYEALKKFMRDCPNGHNLIIVAVDGLAREGYYKELCDLLKKHPEIDLIKYAARWLLYSNQTIALRGLASIPDKSVREELALYPKVDPFPPSRLGYDIKETLETANKICGLMKKYKLNYREAHAWVMYPEIREISLRSFDLKSDGGTELSKDTTTVLVSSISGLTSKEANSLISKMNKYTQPHGINDRTSFFGRRNAGKDNLPYGALKDEGIEEDCDEVKASP